MEYGALRFSTSLNLVGKPVHLLDTFVASSAVEVPVQLLTAYASALLHCTCCTIVSVHRLQVPLYYCTGANQSLPGPCGARREL